MALKIALILLSLKSIPSKTLVEYRFGYNFGEVFRDYSGNSNDAVNGDSSLNENRNVIASDRGAFFSVSKKSQITLPPNDFRDFYLTLPSTFTLMMWVLNYDYDYYFFIRNSTTGDLFTIFRDKNGDKIEILFTISGQNTSSKQGNVLEPDMWNFFSFTIDGNNAQFYANLEDNKILSLSALNYLENSNFEGYIGCEYGNLESFSGFIWNFIIVDAVITQSLYVAEDVTESICIVQNCLSTCEYYFKNLTITGCISMTQETINDGKGNLCETGCNTSIYSCISSVCLSCSCLHKSCILDSSNAPVCWCPSNAYASSNTCKCLDSDIIFDGFQCETNCNSDCKVCDSTGLTCEICLDDNALPNENGICECKDGYYNETPLTDSGICIKCGAKCITCSDADTCLTCVDNASVLDSGVCNCDDGFFDEFPQDSSLSCLACNDECEKCSDNSICSTCKDENAEPDLDSGCICKPGFYGSASTSSTCKKCYSECLSCISSLICDICISSFSLPDMTQGCVCLPGYYNISALNTNEACIKCYDECSTCDQNSKCKTCITEHASPDPNIGCICDSGYYSISALTTKNSCIKCYNDCAECNENLKCTTCIADLAIPDTNIGCVCNLGYYNISALINKNSCLRCYDECQSCEENFKCSSCLTKFASPYENIGCICDYGFYNTTRLINADACQPCSEECKNCEFTFNYCIECNDEYNMTSDNKCVLCTEGEYFDGDRCRNCPNLCKRCDGVCLECVDKAILSQGSCSCMNGYFQDANTTNCEIDYFECIISSNLNNKVKLSFTEPISETLEETDFAIDINSTNTSIPFSYKLYKLTNKDYLFQLNFINQPISQCYLSLIILKKPLLSTTNKTLNNYYYSTYISFKIVNKAKIAAKAASQVVVGASLGASLISNPSAAWILINTIEVISYIPLSDPPLSDRLIGFFQGIGSFNPTPNFAEDIFDSNSTETPYYEAYKYGFSTSVFLLNTSPTLAVFFIVCFCWPLLLLFSKLEIGKISIKMIKILSNYKYSFFLRFWAQSFLIITLSAIIQIRSVFYN